MGRGLVRRGGKAKRGHAGRQSDGLPCYSVDMPVILAVTLFAAVAGTWAFIKGYRSAKGPGDGRRERSYTCRSCGAAVTTKDNLDGKCGSCWGADFESSSEHADRDV